MDRPVMNDERKTHAQAIYEAWCEGMPESVPFSGLDLKEQIRWTRVANESSHFEDPNISSVVLKYHDLPPLKPGEKRIVEFHGRAERRFWEHFTRYIRDMASEDERDRILIVMMQGDEHIVTSVAPE